VNVPPSEIHRNEDSKGVEKLKEDAKAGGDVAGGARKQLEKKLGRSIVSNKIISLNLRIRKFDKV